MAQARCSATLTASDTCERSAPSISARRSMMIGSPKTTAIRAPGRGTSWRSQRGARNAGRAAEPITTRGRPERRATHSAPGRSARGGPCGPSSAIAMFQSAASVLPISRSPAMGLPVPSEGRGTGNPIAGLREMGRTLAADWNIAIALDGPHGPPRALRPGALWVARLSGRPLVVMGYAARPAFRAPRWDRQLVPLPGARIAVVFGEPIIIERRAEIDGALRSHVSDAVNVAEQRAWTILDSPAAHS